MRTKNGESRFFHLTGDCAFMGLAPGISVKQMSRGRLPEGRLSRNILRVNAAGNFGKGAGQKKEWRL